MAENDNFIETYASPDNPNGLYDVMLGDPEAFAGLDVKVRIKCALADLYSYLVEVANIDPDMAEVVVSRAITEIGLSLAPEIDPDTFIDLIEPAVNNARANMVDRATNQILE